MIHTGTIWVFRCRCGRVHEYKRAVVPIDFANELQAKNEELSRYVQDAAGPETVLLPVATLNAIAERAERAEAKLREVA